MNIFVISDLFDVVKSIIAGFSLNRKSLITFEDILVLVDKSLEDGMIDVKEKTKIVQLINYFIKSASDVALDFGLPYKYYTVNQYFQLSNFVEVEEGRYITLDMKKAWDGLLYDLKQKLLGHKFTITSAYRSPAYQFYIMCVHGTKNNLSLKDVFQTVAPPFHSKHGVIPPAIDILEFFDSKNAESIRAREDWKIFVETAKKYDFLESYPDGDLVNCGVGEPWEFVFRT